MCAIVLMFMVLMRFSQGQECPEGNITLVTALYDIGRSNWLEWSRDFSVYLQYFESILKLNIPMAIFVDPSLRNFVKDKRRDKKGQTKIYAQKFNKIRFYKHNQRIRDVLSDKDFKDKNEILNNPEGNSSHYIIMMNNKPSFLKYASDKNPFNTTHFFWIDAGYGHNDIDFPEHGTWSPCKLLQTKRKITILKMVDLLTFAAYTNPDKMHKKNIYPPFAGGFFGGDAYAVTEYYELYDKVFNSLLIENIVDDDQNVAYHVYREVPRLFNLVDGSWFDIFKVFPG